jgi:peptidoglycan/LPS O-acetylase OafA/YrhL
VAFCPTEAGASPVEMTRSSDGGAPLEVRHRAGGTDRRRWGLSASWAYHLVTPMAGPPTHADSVPTAPAVGSRAPTPLFAYRPHLDGLRAIAVLVVIGYHLNIDGFDGGYIGVDVFFVLSGFLITSILAIERIRTGTVVLRRFWTRRFRRLLPAVILLMAAVLVAWPRLFPLHVLQGLNLDAFATLLYVANWRFITGGESYFDQFADPSPLRHMWSLAIEEQFYVLWPIAIVAGAFLFFRGRRRLAVGVLAGATVLSIVLMAVLYDPSAPSRAYYGTDSRIHQILIGACLAFAVLRWPGALSRFRRPAAYAGMLGIGVSVLLMADTSAFYYRGGSVLVAAATAGVIWGLEADASSTLRAGLSLPAVVWIGTISYGLYLWHWPVQLALGSDVIGLYGTPWIASSILATFVIASASFYLVERPIRRGSPYGFELTPRRTLVTSASAIAVTAVLVVVLLPTERSAWADEDPGLSASPDPAEVVSPAPETTMPSAERPGVTDPLPGGEGGVALLIGDSVSKSLLIGLEIVAAEHGWVVEDAARGGCTIAGGFQVDADNEPYQFSELCDEMIPSRFIDDVDRLQPDLIIWYSGRERRNLRLDDGTMVAMGSDEHTAAIRAGWEASADALMTHGARIVVLEVMPHGPKAPNRCAELDDGRCGGEDGTNADFLNDLLVELADSQPGIETTPITFAVCGDEEPCPRKVEGEVIRYDGVHVDDHMSYRVAQQIWPRIMEAYGRAFAETAES